jgi:flagellum-specific ATP synthase
VNAELLTRLCDVDPVEVTGSLTRVVGLDAEVAGLRARVGDQLRIDGIRGPVPAEVVGINEDRLLVAPYGDLEGAGPGSRVFRASGGLPLLVGDALRGRVLDALGRPIDDGPALTGVRVPLDQPAPHPLRRQRIAAPMPLGVRAIDTLLSCGRGQRVGIFAGSGVGKSTLLGMLARGAAADIVVVGLVGERGREVREFLEDDLGDRSRAQVVSVVATSDEPPLMRLRAALTATRIAEHFRDEGADVLLLVDSLTRYAMAAREIGLAAGEPPATRGYPPSVFAALPRLLERAGPGERGTITALYTVLVEGDDTVGDPIADHARSILDGHVVLSRRLADAGHYPTIDVLASISRLAGKVQDAGQRSLVIRARQFLAAAESARELVQIGAYVAGADPVLDEGLRIRPQLDAFLRQDVHEIADTTASWAALATILNTPADAGGSAA